MTTDDRSKQDAAVDRRSFLTIVGGTVLAAGIAGSSNTAHAAAEIVLPPLPYAENALEPIVSAKTLSFHYGKHHKAYVDNVKKFIAGTPLADKPLEEIIKTTAGKSDQTAIFNNAAQTWNHTFYWQSLSPKGGEVPAALKQKIDASFGGLDACKKALTDAATSQFGSGWAWLIQQEGKLAVIKTPNAETPIVQGIKPLLVIDVWEHAYYLDYQNRRADYVATLVDRLLNWEFAAANLA